MPLIIVDEVYNTAVVGASFPIDVPATFDVEGHLVEDHLAPAATRGLTTYYIEVFITHYKADTTPVKPLLPVYPGNTMDPGSWTVPCDGVTATPAGGRTFLIAKWVNGSHIVAESMPIEIKVT